MPKIKKVKLKRHKIDRVRNLGKSLDNSSGPILDRVLEEVSKLPQFELYPERKTFWDSLTKDHIRDLVNCLCKKYSQLYVECKGKYKETLTLFS